MVYSESPGKVHTACWPCWSAISKFRLPVTGEANVVGLKSLFGRGNLEKSSKDKEMCLECAQKVTTFQQERQLHPEPFISVLQHSCGHEISLKSAVYITRNLHM